MLLRTAVCGFLKNGTAQHCEPLFFSFDAEDTGDENLLRNLNVPETLTLKVGAQVMCACVCAWLWPSLDNCMTLGRFVEEFVWWLACERLAGCGHCFQQNPS